MITSALPEDIELQYRVGETPWLSARAFVGSVGQSRGLEAVAFRLQSKTSAPVPYSIRYAVQVNGGPWSRECADSEFCGTHGESKSITALRVWLTPNDRMTLCN